MNKDLSEKAIDIKGKKYVLVSDRVLYFNETYKAGSITTELISTPEAETVIIKATVQPEPGRTFTAYSQATWGEGMVNKTAALENAETSAVGRALAFMGIGVLDSIASVDEIHKATQAGQRPQTPAEHYAKPTPVVKPWNKPNAWTDPKHKDVAKESSQFDAGDNYLPPLN